MSNTQVLSPSVSHGTSAMVAALIMAVGMGFGRFAFTGIYPQMVSEGVLTVHDGTLAASGKSSGRWSPARCTPAANCFQPPCKWRRWRWCWRR